MSCNYRRTYRSMAAELNKTSDFGHDCLVAQSHSYTLLHTGVRCPRTPPLPCFYFLRLHA
jgi:hypothetical protein